MGTGRFVGRSSELVRLRGVVAGLAEGVGGVALVAGEQGIGKKALLRQGLAGAAAEGCRVCWGTADELRQRLPLLLMVECLGQEARLAVHGEPLGSDGVAGGWRGRGAERGLDQMGPVLSGDPVLAAVERLLALVDRLCVASPVVVVAEDLQWADEASLVAWRRLALAVRQVPLLVVGSFRPVPAVTGRSAGDLVEVVDQAVAAGVLVETPGLRLGFRHGLIRQVLYEGMPGALRAALHLQAARALAEAGAEAKRVAAQLVAVPELVGGGVGVGVAGGICGCAGLPSASSGGRPAATSARAHARRGRPPGGAGDRAAAGGVLAGAGGGGGTGRAAAAGQDG